MKSALSLFVIFGIINIIPKQGSEYFLVSSLINPNKKTIISTKKVGNDLKIKSYGSSCFMELSIEMTEILININNTSMNKVI